MYIKLSGGKIGPIVIKEECIQHFRAVTSEFEFVNTCVTFTNKDSIYVAESCEEIIKIIEKVMEI